MANDTRLARAKRVLKQAKEQAGRAAQPGVARSTATRTAYKINAQGAERALEILSERKPPA